MFIKEEIAMYVDHITVDEFKKVLSLFIDQLNYQASWFAQFYYVHDNIRDLIRWDLIREDEERMQTKAAWKDHQTYDRSFSFPEALEHDKHPEEVNAYAAKTIPNGFDRDELTHIDSSTETRWCLVATAAGSYKRRAMIIDYEVFEPIEYKDILIEVKSKIFNLLIRLKCERDQHNESYG
jgi:hypothetical protein